MLPLERRIERWCSGCLLAYDTLGTLALALCYGDIELRLG